MIRIILCDGIHLTPTYWRNFTAYVYRIYTNSDCYGDSIYDTMRKELTPYNVVLRNEENKTFLDFETTEDAIIFKLKWS